MNAELNENMPVGDIVVKFPQTRVLLEALGIDYCCGGRVPLSQAAGECLAQMRRITDGFSPPSDACATFKALYEGLNALEKDLHEHIHLENNILFPRAQALETMVLS